MKPLKILIIDDIEEVADRLCESFETASHQNKNKFIVNSVFECVNVDDWSGTIKKIKDRINDDNINFILADWGFYRQENNANEIRASSKDGRNIIQLFEQIQNECTRFIGVLVYMYNPVCLPDTKNQKETKLVKTFSGHCKTEFLEVIDTHAEIYSKAKCELYKGVNFESLEFQKIGTKEEFRLYGYMLGNYLYHHLSNKLNKLEEIRKGKLYSNLFKSLLFYTFLYLNINVATSALYDIIKEEGSLKLTGLFIFEIMMSLFLIFFIILKKPKWLIGLFDKN